jgi:hypothetical protein
MGGRGARIHGPACSIGKYTHCKEDLIYIFREMKLRGHVPKFHIHVSTSDLYIPAIGPAILLHQNRLTDCGNI